MKISTDIERVERVIVAVTLSLDEAKDVVYQLNVLAIRCCTTGSCDACSRVKELARRLEKVLP